MHEALNNLTIGPYGNAFFKAKVTFEDYDENDDLHYDLVVTLHVSVPWSIGFKEVASQRFTTTGDLVPTESDDGHQH